MQVIKISDMQLVLDHVVLGEHEPAMFVGQFGAGKTDGVMDWAERRGVHMCKVLLGQYDTVDLKGTPWVREEEDYHSTVWHPASTLPFKGNPRFPKEQPILLFLDELTSATIPVMAVCYQLINERRVGEHELMDNVYIACAGNRDQDKGVVTRMPMPLKNRMTWFEIGVDLGDWSAWASRKYGTAASMVIAFLNWKHDYLCTYDPARPEHVVATPRTWEKAIKYYNRDTMPESIKEASIGGAVGQGVCVELWAFKNIYHEITQLIPAIRKDPGKAPIPDEPSKQYGIAVACSGNMSMKDEKAIHAFNTYLMRMPAEFTVLAWQLAVNRDKLLFECDEFVRFSSKYASVFENT